MRKVLDNLVAAMSILMQANPGWIHEDETNRQIWKSRVSPALQDCKKLRDTALTSSELEEVLDALEIYRTGIEHGKVMSEALGISEQTLSHDMEVKDHLEMIDKLVAKMRCQQTQMEILDITS